MLQMISYREKTDTGRLRRSNEDHSLILDRSVPGYDAGRLGMLFAVADGMGGHAAGEVASRMACDVLRREYGRDTYGHPTAEGLGQRLTTAMACANDDIRTYAQTRAQLAGMGTTLSVLILTRRTAVIGHVGDSRIYRLRGRRQQQLTTDHTQVQGLVDAGRLPPEKAGLHPLRHVLTQALGCETHLGRIDLRLEPLLPGDVYLLCSDGLYDMVAKNEIEHILENSAFPQTACRELVHRALANGGRDNVTVIVVRTA